MYNGCDAPKGRIFPECRAAPAGWPSRPLDGDHSGRIVDGGQEVRVSVEPVRVVTPELVAALDALLPQLTGAASTVTAADLAAMVAAPGQCLLVARDDDGRIVGTATLSTCRTPTRRRAHLDDVVVDGSARGLGVGAALTTAAIDLARALGAEQIDLTSNPDREAANRLYQRLGFRRRETNVYRLSLSP
jgi:ribosomal protein S18 acetylase RimI-like enzyme